MVVAGGMLMRSHLAPQPRYLSGTMPAPLASLLDAPVLEPLLLLAAARRARAVPDRARARMKPYVDAAHSRYRIALELRDQESQGAAFSLLREAGLLALCALAAAEDVAATPSSAEVAWQRLAALAEQSDAPSELARARSLWATDDALAVESLARAEGPALRVAVERSVGWLLALAEVRSPAELVQKRVLRCALFVGAAILIVWALLSYWLTLAALS